MRYPLITPLASRDGSTDKDEKLVNAYGEVDRETKETSVFKRPGLSLSDAVLTGNDIYGQGMFNYDGYWFAVINDILWDSLGNADPFGSLLLWSGATTYWFNDAVVYDGQVWYSQTSSNLNNTPGVDGNWGAAPKVLSYSFTGEELSFWEQSFPYQEGRLFRIQETRTRMLVEGVPYAYKDGVYNSYWSQNTVLHEYIDYPDSTFSVPTQLINGTFIALAGGDNLTYTPIENAFAYEISQL